MLIKLVHKHQFGIHRYYADCDTSRLIIQLATRPSDMETKCLTQRQIDICKKIGFEVEIEE